jgi:hypothetical protein
MQLRKLLVALAGLGIGGSAFALTPLAVNGFNNPNSCNNWIFGAAGAYVQPLGNDFDYARTTDIQSSSGSIYQYSQVTKEHAIDPDYAWAWQGLIDYRYPQTTNDIALGYTHFGESDSDTVHTNGVNNVYSNASGNSFDSVKGSVDNDFDAVNLEAGHTFNDGRLGIRVHGGLQYARISSDFHVTGNTPATANQSCSTNDVANSDSNFHGLGPRVGIGASFDLGNGFSIYGDSGIDLLVGDVNTDADSTFNVLNNGQVAFRGVGTFDGSSQTTIVPGGDAELGLSYTAPLANNVALTVQGGYMVTGYVNPIKRVNSDITAQLGNSVSASTTPSFGVEASEPDHSDFGLQGPYVGLDLSF